MDDVVERELTEQFMTLARSLIDMDADVSGMTTRAANLHLERAGMAAGMDEIQPSPTKAYMTISQVSIRVYDLLDCAGRCVYPVSRTS